MSRWPWQRARGIRQITQGLGTLDREVFEAIAESPTPLLDVAMPPLTRAADHSKLWFAIALALAASGNPMELATWRGDSTAPEAELVVAVARLVVG